MVMVPLKKAAMTVPIPTEDNPGSSRKDAKAETAVKSDSRETRTAPKLKCILSEMLFTRPSIGMTAKPEFMVKLTPMDNTMQAKIDKKIFSRRPAGVRKSIPRDVNSRKTE